MFLQVDYGKENQVLVIFSSVAFKENAETLESWEEKDRKVWQGGDRRGDEGGE